MADGGENSAKNRSEAKSGGEENAATTSSAGSNSDNKSMDNDEFSETESTKEGQPGTDDTEMSGVTSNEGLESDKTFSVDDAVNQAGYGRFQIRLLILAGLGWMADACEIFILSVIGSFMACEWTLERWQVALLTSIVFMGIAIGSPILGYAADHYGRKKCLSISVMILFIFGTVSAGSPSYWWMVVFRAILGFAMGGIAQGLTLCTEYCPASMRGKAGLYLCYFWSVGTVSVILMTWFVMELLDNWRILLLVVAIPCLIVTISLKWYPESARYYLVSHQHEKAVAILKVMVKMNRKDLPPGRLVKADVDVQRGRLRDLFSKEYRLTTCILWYIWLATAFSYYGIALVSPIIIQKGSLLTNKAVNLSSNPILGKLNGTIACERFSTENYVDLLWTSAAEFPGLLLFTILIERCSRKLLLSSSCIISGFLLLLLLVKTEKIITLLLLFAARGIILATFQLIFIVTSETYPTTFRAIAIGFGSSFCRLGGLIVPYVAQVLVIDRPTAAMCLMAVVIITSGVSAMCLPYETKGAEMRESRYTTENKTEE